jgi:hypothetical protein
MHGVATALGRSKRERYPKLGMHCQTVPVPSHLDRILDACSGVELDTGVHKRGRGACSHNKVSTQLESSQSHTATMLQQPHCYHRVSGARVLNVAQLRHDASLRERSCCGKAPVRPGDNRDHTVTTRVRTIVVGAHKCQRSHDTSAVHSKSGVQWGAAACQGPLRRDLQPCKNDNSST